MFFKHLTLIALLLTGCADEKSDEERDNEKNRRELKRLSYAITDFVGAAVEQDGEGFIPVQLTTRTKDNPNGDNLNPILEAKLKLGLFGGLTLTSEKTDYDFNDKRFDAKFTDPDAKGDSSERSIEWQSTIVDGKVENARILTSIGTFELTANDDFRSSFQDTQRKSYSFLVTSETKNTNFTAKLTIENLAEDEAAPQGFTVPRIPKLRSAMRFSGTGIVAQNADRTIYDPLKGTIEMYFPGNARILIDSVDLRNSSLSLSEDLKERKLSGTLFQGAEFKADLALSSDENLKLVEEQEFEFPHSKFTGTFQYSKNDDVWNTAMKIDFLGDVGINSDSLSFRLFPQMQITIFRCYFNTNRWGSRQVFKLRSVDYVKSLARFTNPNASNSDRDLMLRYDLGWKNLKGYYIDGQSGEIVNDEGNWQFELKSDPEGFDNSCTKVD